MDDHAGLGLGLVLSVHFSKLGETMDTYSGGWLCFYWICDLVDSDEDAWESVRHVLPARRVGGHPISSMGTIRFAGHQQDTCADRNQRVCNYLLCVSRENIVLECGYIIGGDDSADLDISNEISSHIEVTAMYK